METPAPSLTDDAFLLRSFVHERSEEAFRQLMARHLPLVWSVARRMVNGDAAMAEDVAQAVLVDFAARAHTLPADMPPGGWLHRHTVFTASKVVRTECRRRAREQASLDAESLTISSMHTPPDKWADIAPHLDGALDRLNSVDRHALLLRYFEERSLRDVGTQLGVSEEAARKRIDRALEKLNTLLKRRGLVTAGVLGMLLRESAVAAPAQESARRILTGAWERVAAGPLAANPSSAHRFRKHWITAGSAAAVVLAALGIYWQYAGEEPVEVSTLTGKRVIAPERAADGVAGKWVSAQVTMTVMTLPEAGLFQTMLDYVPGVDDEALFLQLLPRARELQKAVDPEKTWATAGHPLVILTGVTGDQAKTVLSRFKAYSYPKKFDFDAEKGIRNGASHIYMNIGTRMEMIVRPAKKEGWLEVALSGMHMTAGPEENLWPYREPIPDQPGADSISQPGFFSTDWKSPVEPISGLTKRARDPFGGGGPARTEEPGNAPEPERWLSLLPGRQCLIAMQTHTPDTLPESNSAARRVFLFLKIEKIEP